ncbi:MAG TPA: hypothetical protein PLD27_02080 [bacterium]|nr:hypothetical protein [bacterium]HOL46667.1 hypothetical protein [bacterium]HPQ18355.1 hypothetical protein [bacterium]
MKNFKILFVLFLIFIFAFSLTAQEKKADAKAAEKKSEAKEAKSGVGEKTLKDAKAAKKEKSYDKAAELFLSYAKANAKTKKGAKAYKDAGDMYKKLKDTAKARECYEKAGAALTALKLYKDAGTAYKALGTLLKKEDSEASKKAFNDAINAFKEGLKIEKKDKAKETYYKNIIDLYASKLGDVDTAKSVYEEAKKALGKEPKLSKSVAKKLGIGEGAAAGGTEKEEDEE